MDNYPVALAGWDTVDVALNVHVKLTGGVRVGVTPMVVVIVVEAPAYVREDGRCAI